MTTTNNTTSTDRASRWAVWESFGIPQIDPAMLSSLETHRPQDADQLIALADQLATQAQDRSIELAVDRFIAAAEGWDDEADRYATLRTLELRSGLTQAPEWRARIYQPPAPTGSREKRPLRPLELALIRFAVRRTASITSIAVALLESLATSSELPGCTADTLVRASNGTVTAVDLPGTVRTDPRRNTLPAWARPLLTTAADTTPAGRPLAYAAKSPDPNKIISAVLMQINKLIGSVGLGDQPYIYPDSIRLGAAQQLWETSGFEALADAAGARNWQRLRQRVTYPA